MAGMERIHRNKMRNEAGKRGGGLTPDWFLPAMLRCFNFILKAATVHAGVDMNI